MLYLLRLFLLLFRYLTHQVTSSSNPFPLEFNDYSDKGHLQLEWPFVALCFSECTPDTPSWVPERDNHHRWRMCSKTHLFRRDMGPGWLSGTEAISISLSGDCFEWLTAEGVGEGWTCIGGREGGERNLKTEDERHPSVFGKRFSFLRRTSFFHLALCGRRQVQRLYCSLPALPPSPCQLPDLNKERGLASDLAGVPVAAASEATRLSASCRSPLALHAPHSHADFFSFLDPNPGPGPFFRPRRLPQVGQMFLKGSRVLL